MGHHHHCIMRTATYYGHFVSRVVHAKVNGMHVDPLALLSSISPLSLARSRKHASDVIASETGLTATGIGDEGGTSQRQVWLEEHKVVQRNRLTSLEAELKLMAAQSAQLDREKKVEQEGGSQSRPQP